MCQVEYVLDRACNDATILPHGGPTGSSIGADVDVDGFEEVKLKTTPEPKNHGCCGGEVECGGA